MRHDGNGRRRSGDLLRACALAAWLARPAPAVAAPNELLSLTGFPLAADEYVSGFTLQTWTVRVLAVCRLPVGWTITAGTDGDPGGELSGHANIGAAFIGHGKTGAFHSLFLVQVGAYRAQAVEEAPGMRLPATFAGTATLGRYGRDDGERTVPLSARNVRHAPAARCPAPDR